MVGKQVTPRHAPLLPGLADASDAYRIARSFQIEGQGYGQPVRLDRMPTGDERSAMQRRNADVARTLRPARLAVVEEERARAAIAIMLGGYPSLRNDNIPERIEIYWMQLRDFPLFAIIKSCEDISQRRVEGLDPDYPPSTPRVVDCARQHVGALASEQNLLERVLGAKLTFRPEATPAERERVAAKMRDLANSMNVSNELIGGEDRRKRAAAARTATNRFILREYERLKLEPRYMSDGSLISPSLLEKTAAIGKPR